MGTRVTLSNFSLATTLVSLASGDVNWKVHYISLIEKKPGSLQAKTLDKDLRPISITNEYAKLVSKTLATFYFVTPAACF